MFNLIIILITIISCLVVCIIQFYGRYQRLLSSYKSIGQALVQCGGIGQEQYNKYIMNRK